MAELDARGSVNDGGAADYRIVRENYSEIWLRRFSLVCSPFSSFRPLRDPRYLLG